MTVADIDDAFSYIPLAPWLWKFMLFRWYFTTTEEDTPDPLPGAFDPLHVFVQLFADFG